MMSKRTAQYPGQVFDGHSTGNPNRNTARSQCDPDFNDYDHLVAEIIATQEKVNDLCGSVGPTGPMGPAGEDGATGPTGPTGFQAAKVGWFICPALGNYSVVGLGFKPKTVKFWVSKGPGLQTHFCCCQGMMDAFGNQNSMTWAGVWSNIFKGDSRTDKCMYTINSSGNSQVTASFVSMDDDGFTVNFTNVNPLFIIRWEAIG